MIDRTLTKWALSTHVTNPFKSRPSAFPVAGSRATTCRQVSLQSDGVPGDLLGRSHRQARPRGCSLNDPTDGLHFLVWMEADGFVSRRTSLDTPGVDGRVTGAAAGTGLRFLGGRLLDATGGLVGPFSPIMSGGQDFVSVVHRTSPDTSTSVEPEIDYEGLPQGASTRTHMLAGSVAGIMEHCLMYPIDCVKVLKHANAKKSASFEVCRGVVEVYSERGPCCVNAWRQAG